MIEQKKKNNNIPVIEEQEAKTYNSEPVSLEEMQKLRHDFYEDDIFGGLHNIQVSEEEIERQRRASEYIKSFIEMIDHSNVPCYRTDKIHLKLTPEQLVVLIQALESFSLNMYPLEYLSEERGISKLYEQQSYIRMLRDLTDDVLNSYVKHRPYSPFLPVWFKKIGKNDVDKENI